jgi:ribonuclease HI
MDSQDPATVAPQDREFTGRVPMIASQPKPHYLLFSTTDIRDKAEAESRCAEIGGRWRFQLESLDGSASFGAVGEERPMDRGRLELLAVVRGLEALDHPSDVTLVTSSRYVSRGIRFGLRSWRDSGWRWEHFGQMAAVRNADLWRRIDVAMQIHHVRCKPFQFHFSEWDSRMEPEPPAATDTSPAATCDPDRIMRRWLLRVQAYWRIICGLPRSHRTVLCPQ